MRIDGASGIDPLTGDPRVAAFFGERFEAVEAFDALLREHGVEQGLIGPNEVGRLWERHLLNSAAVVPFLPDGPMADVGSGAGLPGLVVAAMEPERDIVLIEPMERRVAWLEEAVSRLGLERVRVIRARAEEAQGRVQVVSVIARAVAPISRLVPWCASLLSENGVMLLLKGRAAQAEVGAAENVLKREGFYAEVIEAMTLSGLEPARVVRLSRDRLVGSGGRLRLES